MKEIRNIIKASEALETGQRAALATVVRVEGSSYRQPGARMLVQENGQWVGGISGGCLEGDALRKARLAILQGKPRLITYDTNDEDGQQIGASLGCNGIIDVLIAPLTAGDAGPIALLRDCAGFRQPSLLITVVQSKGMEPVLQPGQMFRYQGPAQLKQDLGGLMPPRALLQDIERAQQAQRSISAVYTLETGELHLFIEFLAPSIRLLLFGGQYDVYPLAELASNMGHLITIYADRNKLDASILGKIEAAKPKDATVAADAYTACVLMAHDYKTDLGNLRRLLDTPTPYIALLGPRKRTEKMIRAIEKDSGPLSDAENERIYSPAGLDIGAMTPEEIALSILAEIQAHYGGRQGGALRLRSGPIHYL